MKKAFIILVSILSLIIIFFSFFKPKESKEEKVCKINCKSADQVVLKDGSKWHVISYDTNKSVLFSDANIDLEGNYLSVDYNSFTNTGQPVAFDKAYERKTEESPYCIYPDLGCSAYSKNFQDVFSDSSIKKIIDSKYAPKIKKILDSEDIEVRLLKRDEFLFFKELEEETNGNFGWLYHSGYWLMDSFNEYSVYAFLEKSYNLTHIAPSTAHKVGIRPVIEINTKLIS